MSVQSIWNYLQVELYSLTEWAKCGDNCLSLVPTVLWAAGAAGLVQRLLTSLFRRFLFRRVPLWEVILQHMLFIWMVIYSLHFWMILVRFIKAVVEFCLEDGIMSFEDIDSKKVLQQWVAWMCGAAPLAYYLHTRPAPERAPLMIWITASPWQRREMGPYGYYLNRPLSSIQDSPPHLAPLRRAYSDSKIVIKEPPKRRRYSKSV